MLYSRRYYRWVDDSVTSGYSRARLGRSAPPNTRSTGLCAVNDDVTHSATLRPPHTNSTSHIIVAVVSVLRARGCLCARCVWGRDTGGG